VVDVGIVGMTGAVSWGADKQIEWPGGRCEQVERDLLLLLLETGLTLLLLLQVECDLATGAGFPLDRIAQIDWDCYYPLLSGQEQAEYALPAARGLLLPAAADPAASPQVHDPADARGCRERRVHAARQRRVGVGALLGAGRRRGRVHR